MRVDWINWYVLRSSSATASISISLSSTLLISCTAWAIADCMRTPRMSSLRSPISSTSSLSNSTIGKPPALNCTGARSRKVASDRTMAHGCIARCRGKPSSCAASAIVARVRGADVFKFFNSGNELSAASILPARIWGIDFARRSISMAGMPRAAPASRIA